mmetsp:Transcript_74401/g.162735  ORF Transcript_74401/g.162735 Transcript_74401/m.162735 type:complete len:88 (+) Transcript_74401:387-650(+)
MQHATRRPANDVSRCANHHCGDAASPRKRGKEEERRGERCAERQGLEGEASASKSNISCQKYMPEGLCLCANTVLNLQQLGSQEEGK